MKKGSSILIMLHCEQNTGYAIGVLEQVFLEAARKSGYSDEEIFWSYKSVEETATNIIQCDYKSVDQEFLYAFLTRNSINQVIAFDLNYPSPVIDTLKRARVKRVISYWGAGMSSINSGIKLIAKRLEWLLRSNKPDHFIFESEAMRKTATAGRGVPHNRTSVVPLGVDTQTYRPDYGNYHYAHTLLGIPADRKIVFYSGHMEERKGVRVIVKAAIELVDNQKNKGLHFVLCGNKGDEARVYQQLLKGTEAAEHVTFAGYRNDIADLMRSSFVGVIASTGWDSFTMSSVEMMASGLPLIVSNLQGLSETTIDNVTGFYITPGDYRELAERIGILSTSPTLAKDFSSAARLRAVKRFSRERQVTDIAALLSADSNQLSTNT